MQRFRLPSRFMGALAAWLITPAAFAGDMWFEHVQSFGERIDNGPGATNYPSGVTVDVNTGHIYVMDLLNSRIQKFDRDGTPLLQWPCRQGLGITVDPETGSIYAAMWTTNQVIRYSPSGEVELTLGTKKRSAEEGDFDRPHDVSVDPRNGDLYVLDTFNKRIQVFNRKGEFQRAWKFDAHQPFGISVHPKGEFLVVANTANRELIKMSLDGEILERWKRKGSKPGMFRWPRNVAVDADGFIYVADTDNERAQKLTSDGEFVQFIQGPNGREGSFHPRAIEVDWKSGEVFAAAAYANRIDHFDKSGKHQKSFGEHKKDGPVFNTMKDILIHPNGDIYVSDWMDHRVRRFSASGEYKGIFDIWIPEQTNMDGLPFPPDFATNPATGMWIAKEDQGFPGSMDVDSKGNIWLIRGSMHYDDDPRKQADWLVRSFTPEGEFVSGFGHRDFPRNARMRGIAVDGTNDTIYVANTFGNRVMKFQADGTAVWSVGSKGSGSGQFDFPTGIDVDPKNQHVYVVDSKNNRVVKMDMNGKVLTTWGEKGAGEGQFNFAGFSTVAWDPKGYVFVADTHNHRVQVFKPDGTFVTQYGEKGFGKEGRYNGFGYLRVHDGKLYVSDNAGYEVEIYTIHYP